MSAGLCIDGNVLCCVQWFTAFSISCLELKVFLKTKNSNSWEALDL